ncbi:unnamed protein product [Adineta steineri]|uniref:PhoD-like phosphatase domain-containing protein n=1 Tax=Adineta steineri TaxID=433720 RepID=A0A815ZZ97_9BILA|nr:unnamed protein product [Adineta steineri]CAF1588465.1 unnamed protein product [Adineta steineri]
MEEGILNEDNNKYNIVVKDRFGDLEVDAPNPVNPNPHDNGDCPEPKLTATQIEDMPPPIPVSIQSPHITRPPKQPGPALGPYYQFLTTDLKKMLWFGSALILRDISYDQPEIEFFCEPKLDFNWEILYDNLFNMRIYRINISIELRDGKGDDIIRWKMNWGDHITDGLFHIARYNQNWRGGFFSCNGFDSTVPDDIRTDLTFGTVWEHLNSVHEETPLHILIWGGDQTYVDFIFEDVPYLKEWVDMEWNQKWTCDFRDDLKEQIEQYHFNSYIQNWERPEVKNALASIPSIMMWDDHDIFDGAGSYPPLLHDSPMMTGLFKCAQKMRLLFQHHTTEEKARVHGLFGYQGYNSLTQCGPDLVIIGTDGRTERDTNIVHHPESWNMIFDKLENDIINIKHLIVVFPVPFSFVRFKLAENIFDHIKKFPNRFRNVPPIKQTNSIFGLPELYDDLLDEWTNASHIDERNRELIRFQKFAERKRIRITFFSGDVHCCGISRFKKRQQDDLLPINDSKLMYQVISSAIVNKPPSRQILFVAHYVRTKWYPVEETVEELIDFFQRLPETGRKVRHKKLMSNRNWCFFEICEEDHSTVYKNITTGCLQRVFKSKQKHIPAVKLGPTSSREGHGSAKSPIHIHSHNRSCSHRKEVGQDDIGTHTLKIRLWLESGGKHTEGRKFVSYELLIPNLI